MATFKTKKEKKFIEANFSTREMFWLGASDREVENVWKWVDGTDMDRRLFGLLEPNDFNNEDCLANYPIRSKYMHVADVGCTIPAIFLCEYKSNCFIVK